MWLYIFIGLVSGAYGFVEFLHGKYGWTALAGWIVIGCVHAVVVIIRK